MQYRMNNDSGFMRTYVFDNEPQKKPSAKNGTPSGTAGKNGGKRQPQRSSRAVGAPTSGKKSGGAVSARKNVRRGSAVRTPEAVTRKKIKVHTVRSTEHKKFPLGIVFSMIACTIVFMIMLWSFVQINEETQRIELLEYQLKTAVKQETELTFKLEEKNNLKTIEEYAKNELGMVQIDQLAKKYISVTSADRIEVVDEDSIADEDEDDGGIFETLREKFEELLEYFS